MLYKYTLCSMCVDTAYQHNTCCRCSAHNTGVGVVHSVTSMPSSHASVFTVMVLPHPGGPARAQKNNTYAKEQSILSTAVLRQLTRAKQHLSIVAIQAHDLPATSL